MLYVQHVSILLNEIKLNVQQLAPKIELLLEFDIFVKFYCMIKYNRRIYLSQLLLCNLHCIYLCYINHIDCVYILLHKPKLDKSHSIVYRSIYSFWSWEWQFFLQIGFWLAIWTNLRLWELMRNGLRPGLLFFDTEVSRIEGLKLFVSIKHISDLRFSRLYVGEI